MKSEEYRSILGRLPIKCPTQEDMAMLCPHLTAKQAVEAFTAGEGYVACPPLRVRSAFQIVSYHPEWVEQLWEWQKDAEENEVKVITGAKNHPAVLTWSYAGRSDASTKYKRTKEAIRFAEDNWGPELISDGWVDATRVYIQDPTDLVNDRYHHDYPRTKAVLGVMLNRDLNELMNDHSRPASILFDEAVVQMTLDPLVWHELKGGRGGFTEFNCAHCGAGLLLSSCSGCGARFTDDHSRTGGYTPLSPKMVAFLRENGHEFAIDPGIAWVAERERWESARR